MSQYQSQKHIGFLDIVWYFKYKLALYIVGISCLTFIGLYLLGGVPDELKVVSDNQAVGPVIALNGVPSDTDATLTSSSNKPEDTAVIPKIKTNNQSQVGEMPTHITIDKAGIDIPVNVTTSANNDVLNNVLLKGAVRYPGSGTLGHGNMLILAHSSHLRIVNNQAFKAFNNLEKLNLGDIIHIQSATKTYSYKVISVEMTNTEDGFVDLKSDQNMVTLVTCNVLAEKGDRFMVKAVYIP